MELLLAIAQPEIRDIKDLTLKEAVMKRLRTVSERALGHVAEFSSPLDSVPADRRRNWRMTFVKSVTKPYERIMCALKRSSNAEACRVAIAQSYEPLVLALLL